MSELTTPQSQPVTFDDILRLFAQWREENRLEAERRDAEAKIAEEKRLAEAKIAEEKRLAEAKIAEEKRLAEAKIAEEKRLAEAKIAEEKRLAEAKKEMQALRSELGKLGNRLGDFVQEMVKPAAVRLFQERGLPVHRILPNMQYRSDDGQSTLEVDLFVINGTVGILIECKSHASIDDVNEHLERLVKFRQVFYEFKDIKLHAAIAAMVMPDEVARYAYKKGLFVMAQNGDSILIKNDDKFKPQEW